MDEQLKNKVIDKIREIYPGIRDDEPIVLYGSRAKGYASPDSDIDTWIFTSRKKYFEKISFEKGLRKKGEDPGFEIKIDGGLHLESKIQSFQIPLFDCMLYHDLLKAQPLTSSKKFKQFQSRIRKEFMNRYEDILFHSYVHFFNEFKNLEGISPRTDPLSKINLLVKKGVVIQALLRLALVIEKQPYTFDKFLAQEASKTRHWKPLLKFIKKIEDMESYAEYCSFKDDLREFINKHIPPRPYVGAWWKFLGAFKEVHYR